MFIGDSIIKKYRMLLVECKEPVDLGAKGINLLREVEGQTLWSEWETET